MNERTYQNSKQDQDSWTGSTGSGPNDSKPLVHSSIFCEDGNAVPCRRSHLSCSGFYACELIHPDLVNVTRHELDPKSLEKVVELQIGSRWTEADSPEKNALLYVNLNDLASFLFPLSCLVDFSLLFIQVHAQQKNPVQMTKHAPVSHVSERTRRWVWVYSH